MPDKPEKQNRIDCYQCIHYYVTWDREFPKGCRAMGFKSKKIPSCLVQESSGMQCLKFEEKEKENERTQRKNR